MVHPLSIHGNITAQDQRRWFFLDNLVQKCLQKLWKILYHLAVTALHKKLECFASVSGRSALIVEIGSKNQAGRLIGLLRLPQIRKFFFPLTVSLLASYPVLRLLCLRGCRRYFSCLTPFCIQMVRHSSFFFCFPFPVSPMF